MRRLLRISKMPAEVGPLNHYVCKYKLGFINHYFLLLKIVDILIFFFVLLVFSYFGQLWQSCWMRVPGDVMYLYI